MPSISPEPVRKVGKGKMQKTVTRITAYIYWSVWGVVLLIVLFTIHLWLPSEEVRLRSIVFIVYIVPPWLAIIIVNVLESSRLMNYLKRGYPSTWAEITSTGMTGPGGVNSYRLG